MNEARIGLHPAGGYPAIAKESELNIADMIRENATTQTRDELIKLARECDNIWVLQEAISLIESRRTNAATPLQDAATD